MLELTETGRDHHSQTYRCNKHVAQEKTERTTIHEGGRYSEEEAGTDDTTNTGSKVGRAGGTVNREICT